MEQYRHSKDMEVTIRIKSRKKKYKKRSERQYGKRSYVF